jgi:hypothetical protein
MPLKDAEHWRCAEEMRTTAGLDLFHAAAEGSEGPIRRFTGAGRCSPCAEPRYGRVADAIGSADI